MAVNSRAQKIELLVLVNTTFILLRLAGNIWQTVSQASCSTHHRANPRDKNFAFLRPSGIEPEAIAWEAMILPLNQERSIRLEKKSWYSKFQIFEMLRMHQIRFFSINFVRMRRKKDASAAINRILCTSRYATTRPNIERRHPIPSNYFVFMKLNSHLWELRSPFKWSTRLLGRMLLVLCIIMCGVCRATFVALFPLFLTASS